LSLEKSATKESIIIQEDTEKNVNNTENDSEDDDVFI
jgi:hypothetical protein